MANDVNVTICGNLTSDPVLRYTSTGKAVTDFTVAQTPRTYDSIQQQWNDKETFFFRCSAWDKVAENVADSLRKGMRIIVQGKLLIENYVDRDDHPRTNLRVQIDEVGPSLRYASASVTRNPSNSNNDYRTSASISQDYVNSPLDEVATPSNSFSEDTQEKWVDSTTGFGASYDGLDDDYDDEPPF